MTKKQFLTAEDLLPKKGVLDAQGKSVGPLTFYGDKSEGQRVKNLARYVSWPTSSSSKRHWWNGDLVLVPEDATKLPLPAWVVATETYWRDDKSTWIEDRMGGVQWALSQTGVTIGMWLDKGSQAIVDNDGLTHRLLDSDTPPGSMLLLDGRKLQQTCPAPPEYGKSQSISLVGATLHMLPPNYRWSPNDNDNGDEVVFVAPP